MTFNVQFVYNGTVRTLEKRFKEFLDLHKRLQKTVTLRADFPPKTVLLKDDKFLNKRRQGLENYLQAVIHEGTEELPLEVYHFFDIDPYVQQEDDDDADSTDGGQFQRPICTHQPVVAFDEALFLELSAKEILEEKRLNDIVLQGSLDGFYND
eukprot:gene9741-10737_t